MISKQDILKLARTIVKRRSGKAPRRAIDPVREWIRGLSVAALLLIGGLAYAGLSFSAQLHSTDIPPTVEVTVPQYDQAALTHTLEVYRARKEKFETMHGSAISGQYTEPSTIEGDTSKIAPPSTGPLEAI